MTNIWWLSLHPKWAELVKAGKKTLELRKKIPKNMKAGDMVIVYTTLPVGKIEMVWEVKSITKYPFDCGHLQPMCETEKHRVNDDDVEKYFYGCDYGYGIEFEQIYKDLDITLSAIKQAGFTPPQGIVKGEKLAKHFKMEI